MSDAADSELKGGKRERTRAKLIQAASTIIAERGFAAASLDEIARCAGMTKGAIYSNFKNKSELLIAVRASRSPLMRPRLEPGAPLKRQMRIIAEALLASLPRMKAESRFIAEFHLHAQDEAEFRAALESQYTAFFDRAEDMLGLSPGALNVPARDLMVVIQSLSLGFVYQSFLSPREIAPRVVLAAFDALADGVSGEKGSESFGFETRPRPGATATRKQL
jgi:AcrR family transcriptional regulator